MAFAETASAPSGHGGPAPSQPVHIRLGELVGEGGVFGRVAWGRGRGRGRWPLQQLPAALSCPGGRAGVGCGEPAPHEANSRVQAFTGQTRSPGTLPNRGEELKGARGFAPPCWREFCVPDAT